MSRAVRLQSSSSLPEGVEQRIANLYAPNLSSCWGVECVQVGAVTATTGLTHSSCPTGPVLACVYLGKVVLLIALVLMYTG